MANAKFGIISWGDTPEDYVHTVRIIDQQPFDFVGVPDSQSVYGELYVLMTHCLLNTKGKMVAPWVTNPWTRHPAVTVSAVGTLRRMFGNRVALGFGSGDSALQNLKMRPASLADMERYVHALRALFRGEAVEWQSSTGRVAWSKEQMPIYLAADGPKTARLAGKIADGVVIGAGITPEVVHHFREQVAAGAKEAGRRIEDVDIWWLVKGNVHESREAAVNEIRASLCSSVNHGFRFTLEGKFVPKEFHAAITKIQSAYAAHEHNIISAGVDNNAMLVEQSGMKEWLANRFAVAGAPDQCVEQIQRGIKAGATQMFFRCPVAVARRPQFLEAMGKVIQRVKNPAVAR
ncbi:MAG: LLM class flavin-dependent oxidoreductase [Dehalococcoidia bacterium]|nr:LLM class flavin-dependent oxidoreductase [Dehalococcoidia bacterium]